MKKIFKLKRIFLLLLIPLSFFITYIAKRNSSFAEEVFSKRIYHVISIVVSKVTGLFPFSIGENKLFINPIIYTILFIRFIFRLIRCEGFNPKIHKKGSLRLKIAGKGILNVLCFFSVLLFLYTIECGVNYYRYPFSHYSNLTVQESTEEELKELCISLATQANELRSQITSEDIYGVYKLPNSKYKIRKDVVTAYKNLEKTYPILSGPYPAAKPLLVSKLMSRMELTGIFWPFTMEANVNIDIPDYSIPSTMAHEMAHMRGFMREDEANYIAYLACKASDQIELKYSGVLEALIIAGNALYDKDPELYREIAAMYSVKVRIDLNANSEYWRQFENKTASNVADKVNNTYLIMNDQKDGVQSYGRMVDLLLAEYRASK